MLNQRLHVIQEWVDKTINLDQTANAAIALGIALAHINELVSALTAANAETVRLQLQLNLDALKTKMETTPFIYTPPNPLPPFTPRPLDQTPRTPFIMRYGADGNQTLAEQQVAKLIKNYKEEEEVTFNDELSLPVIDGNAEFKTEFYGSRNYNGTQITTNLEKDLGAALIQATNCVNIEQKYDEELFSKPTTLKSLLDKHFEEADGVPYFVAQIKTPTIDELTPVQGEYDYTPRFTPAVNNLTPEQIIGTQPFTGTLADLPTHMPATHSASVKCEADKAAYTERNTRLAEEKFTEEGFTSMLADVSRAQALLAEAQLAEAAFIKKYGGKVAVIDTPFDGLAVMAPGMNEDGHIGSVSYNEQYAQQLIAKANELIEETK